MLLKSCTVVILAAGKSRRMGQPKFALNYGGGLSFIQNIVHQYVQAGCNEIVAVFNPSGIEHLRSLAFGFNESTRIVENPYTERGRFTSLQCGFAALRSNDCVFVHNVDNPLVEKSVLKKLYSNIGNCDFATPVFEGKGGHPVLVKKNVVEAVLGEKNGSTIFRDFLRQFKGKRIEFGDESILWNINKPEDLAKFYKNR